MPQTSLREVGLLRRLCHPNIVTLLEVVVGSKLDSVFLVLEHVDHDLARLIDSQPAPFTPAVVKRLMLQLFSAMAHLHANWVLHRDVKLSNLLYSEARGELKLCDFGLARRGTALEPWRGEAAYTPKVVTLWYRAPELLLGATSYGAAVDAWSLGCVLGELLLHRPLMPASTELAQLKAMCALLGTPHERIWPGFNSLPLASKLQLPQQPYNELPTRFERRPTTPETLALLNELLLYDPKKRLTTRDALNHAYFATAPLPQPMAQMPRFGGGGGGGSGGGSAAASSSAAAADAKLQRAREAREKRVASQMGAANGDGGDAKRRCSVGGGASKVDEEDVEDSAVGGSTTSRGGGGASVQARLRSPASIVASGVRQL